MFSQDRSYACRVTKKGEVNAGFKTVAQTQLRQLSGQGQEFDPETIAVMAAALKSAVASLSYLPGTRHIQVLARSVLCQAALGERDVERLHRTALEALKRAG